jgi:hypothetical protein
MTLEERYNAATPNTYVGRVKNLQASDVGGNKPGVNFMDGDARGEWSPSTTPAPDQVQAEFTRNTAGDFRYGGGGKTPAATNDKTYPLSRWLTKGVDKGDAYLTNNRFTTVNDTRNSGTLLQRYNWLKESDTFTGKLSNFSKGKVIGSASGPSPNGLQG